MQETWAAIPLSAHFCSFIFSPDVDQPPFLGSLVRPVGGAPPCFFLCCWWAVPLQLTCRRWQPPHQPRMHRHRQRPRLLSL